MAQIIKSLDEITTGFSFFEKDQVLTASQLNSISNYFDDQTRLTRTQLLGVGIACGLEPSIQSRVVKIGKGMGVTTDGDLLFFTEDQVFDRFRPYDEKNPKYPAFYVEEKMIPLFELVSKDANDKRTMPLSRFTEVSGIKLSSAVAILYMESYLFDPDDCAGSDCDNLGKEFRNTPRLLLVDRQYLDLLKHGIKAPHDIYDAFEEIVAERPMLTASIKTQSQLTQQYTSACASMSNKLEVQLQQLFKNGSFFLSDVYPADPWPEWAKKLAEIQTRYRRDDTGIQYYYDFLKDLVDTFNDFLDLIFEDSTWCSPAKEAFPKHLILGTLGKNGINDRDRTSFYYSHLSSHSLNSREQALFLVKKLDVLIEAFQPPVNANSEIRITPGKSEYYKLEERPIPYYYQVDRTHQVHQAWNYQLSRRNKGNYNYSYNAPLYNAQGGAANPLGSQIGKFDFFRIEGHIGKGVASVHSFLEREIRRLNLPFNSRSIMLSDDPIKLVIKPGFLFTDLHKLHNLMRRDVLNQLDEVKRYSTGLKSLVKTNLEILDPEDRGTFDQIAEGRDNDLHNSVELASVKLRGSFQEYEKVNTANDSWKSHVGNAMQHSGNFKGQLSIAAKTEFNTPFDSLISNRNFDLLDHLDDLIKVDTEKRQKRLLFGSYINEHPGMEHNAGVSRGGTFIVLYDEAGIVIGDFMIPYMEIDADQLDESEPPLTIRPIRPGFVIDKGINLFSPFDKKVRLKLETFKSVDLDNILNLRADAIKTNLDTTWNNRFNQQQNEYFNTIKESWGTMSSALIKTKSDLLTGDLGGIKDSGLGKAVKDMKSMREVLAGYKTKAEQVTDPVEKEKYNNLANVIEDDLSKSITDLTQQIADSGEELSVGTDGFNAMLEVNNGLSVLNTETIVTRTTENLTQLSGTGRKASFNLMLGNILKR
ncbi:MAG: hypothetical protein IPH84_12355 [Bacteroidales bacterium]|nr:hypothetical protein [Bacteroidales bacterium]